MTNVQLRHPRRKRLRAWLESGGDDRVTRHVEHCERCARELEALATELDESGIASDKQLGAAIRQAMAPPDDLNERVMLRIGARERAEREVSLLLGLIAIPRDAMDLMLPPEPTPEAPRGLSRADGRPPEEEHRPDEHQREDEE